MNKPQFHVTDESDAERIGPTWPNFQFTLTYKRMLDQSPQSQKLERVGRIVFSLTWRESVLRRYIIGDLTKIILSVRQIAASLLAMEGICVVHHSTLWIYGWHFSAQGTANPDLIHCRTSSMAEEGITSLVTCAFSSFWETMPQGSTEFQIARGRAVSWFCSIDCRS